MGWFDIHFAYFIIKRRLTEGLLGPCNFGNFLYNTICLQLIDRKLTVPHMINYSYYGMYLLKVLFFWGEAVALQKNAYIASLTYQTFRSNLQSEE